MNSTKYTKAIREVNEYLKGIRKEDLDKIPNDFLKYLNENEDKDYECKFDYTKSLKEIELSEEAKGIILYITYNYWCGSDKDKKEFYNKLNENEIIFEEQLKEKFSKTSNLFLNENKDTNNKKKEENLSIVNIELDESKNKISIFTKLLNFIKRLKKKN